VLSQRLGHEHWENLKWQSGFTQEDMRDHGFGYRYYQRIEAGEKDLRMSTLDRLANTFKVSIHEFFDFD
jgi:transcriptional regulator with XRE-family HTH domain